MDLYLKITEIIPGFFPDRFSFKEMREIISYYENPNVINQDKLKAKMSEYDLVITYIYFNKMFHEQEKKYRTLKIFLSNYPYFSCANEEYPKSLMRFANFVNIVKESNLKNIRYMKGFVFLVGAKVCDGWNMNYVLGSGQRKEVKDRVHIFEKETKVFAKRKLDASIYSIDIIEELDLSTLYEYQDLIDKKVITNSFRKQIKKRIPTLIDLDALNNINNLNFEEIFSNENIFELPKKRKVMRDLFLDDVLS